MQEKPGKLRVALIGGVVIGLISAIPGLNLINCCCCAGVILGGLFSTYLYLQELTPQMPPLETSDTLTLGIMAGVIGAFAATFTELLIWLSFGSVGEEFMKSFVEGMIQNLEQSGSLSTDVAEELRNRIDESIRQSKTMFGILSGLFTSLILFPIFTVIGALIGYSIFKPKKSEVMPQQ